MNYGINGADEWEHFVATPETNVLVAEIEDYLGDLHDTKIEQHHRTRLEYLHIVAISGGLAISALLGGKFIGGKLAEAAQAWQHFPFS
jgi:hypothetical protein